MDTGEDPRSGRKRTKRQFLIRHDRWFLVGWTEAIEGHR